MHEFLAFRTVFSPPAYKTYSIDLFLVLSYSYSYGSYGQLWVFIISDLYFSGIMENQESFSFCG